MTVAAEIRWKMSVIAAKMFVTGKKMVVTAEKIKGTAENIAGIGDINLIHTLALKKTDTSYRGFYLLLILQLAS